MSLSVYSFCQIFERILCAGFCRGGAGGTQVSVICSPPPSGACSGADLGASGVSSGDNVPSWWVGVPRRGAETRGGTFELDLELNWTWGPTQGEGTEAVMRGGSGEAGRGQAFVGLAHRDDEWKQVATKAVTGPTWQSPAATERSGRG